MKEPPHGTHRPADETSPVPAPEPAPQPFLVALLQVLIPLALLVGGALGAKHLLDTPPHTRRRPQERRPRLVEVTRARRGPSQVIVEATGTVVAARRIELRPQIAGRLIPTGLDLVPGGLLETIKPAFRIEPRDFELARDQRRQEVADAEQAVTAAAGRVTAAEAELKLEMGNQAVARLEFELLGEKVDPAQRELLLRQPQLARAQGALQAAKADLAGAGARLEAARARLAEARLHLDRTVIRAPFPCIVESKAADIGQTVTPSSTLAVLVGTGRFWIEARLPQAQLPWLEIPRQKGDPASTVHIHNPDAWGPKARREGRVLRLVPGVEPSSRLARVLIALDDPLALTPANRGRPALLLDTYVHLRIQGRVVADAVSIPRSLLRDGNRIWVMDDGDRLDLRPVEILHRGRDNLLLRNGIDPGDRLVTTDLATPVQGMPLVTDTERPR